MATININIPDSKLTEVIDLFCYQFNYEENIPSLDASGNTITDQEGNVVLIPNTETKAQFTKRKVIELIKANCLDARRKQREETFRSNILNDENNINNINIT